MELNIIEESIEKYAAQSQYCSANNKPMYADRTCFSCNENFWQKVSLKEASTTIITGCRFCSKSFV